MSGPTIGIGRIDIPYTVSGRVHHCRMYVSNPTSAGATWNIDLHPDIGGAADWEGAADGLAAALSYMLESGVTPGTALLEEYSATGWLPRATTTVTFPNVNGSTKLASQVTLTLRAMDFTRPKIVLLEQVQPTPATITTPDAGGASYDGFTDAFLGTSVVAGRPWAFMTTMHGIFLLSASFVKSTTTFNRKLRRARGLA